MTVKQSKIIVRIVVLKERMIATANRTREVSCRNEIIRLYDRLQWEKHQEEAREIRALATPNQQERLESVYH